MQVQDTRLTNKMELSAFFARLGKIFSNLSILALALCFCGLLSIIL